MRAQRFRKGDLLFRRRLRALQDPARRTAPRVARPAVPPECGDPPRWRGRSAPVSTSPSDRTPRKPLRNAVRSLPVSVAGSRSQKRNAPDTAQSPGSAATSNTNVSDGSSAMVRSSFTGAALRVSDRATTALASACARLPLGLFRADPLHTVGRHCRRCAGWFVVSRASRPRYCCARLSNPSVCQQSKATIRCRAKLSVTSTAPISSKPFLLQRRRERMNARLGVGHRDRADHGAEHQPGRRFHLASRTSASRAARRRPGRRRRGSRPASRSSPACSAAHRRARHPLAPPCRHRTRGARYAAARSARAPRQTRRGRTARHRPAFRPRSSAHIAAHGKMPPRLSRSRTSV